MSFTLHNKKGYNENIEKTTLSARLSPYYLLIPFSLILIVLLYFILNGHFDAKFYIERQKTIFYFINQKLLAYPLFEYNLTQLGDAVILLSFLTIFIVYRPTIWRALVPALIASAVLTPLLKSFFAIPRPAAAFDHNTFTIVGRTLMGHNSFPSGHSITIFTIITILIVVFLPKQKNMRWLWAILMISLGYFIACSRIAVGAHYPLDVFVGSCIGSICGILGILFVQYFPNVFLWIGKRRFHPLFILLMLTFTVLIIIKIIHSPLTVYYLSILNLLISLYVIVKDYIKI